MNELNLPVIVLLKMFTFRKNETKQTKHSPFCLMLLFVIPITRDRDLLCSIYFNLFEGLTGF